MRIFGYVDFGYVNIEICGYLDTWIFGYVAIFINPDSWIFGYVDVGIFGFLDM